MAKGFERSRSLAVKVPDYVDVWWARARDLFPLAVVCEKGGLQILNPV